MYKSSQFVVLVVRLHASTYNFFKSTLLLFVNVTPLLYVILYPSFSFGFGINRRAVVL